MSASIIAIGNPGAGKSTVLNSLAGELLFKSGVSLGAGLTYQLDEKKNERGRFFDTPGLSDDAYRQAAATAISTALKKGGPFKILFFVRLEAGRLVREDITTFKLVLESAPEIGNKYGIVTNKLKLPVAELIQDPKQAETLLTKLFQHIPEENRCPPSSITYLTHKPEADCVNNYLLNLDELITLDGSYFSDFVYTQIETVQLTVGKANDINIESWDRTTNIIDVLERRNEENQEMFKEQQRVLLEQLEKAENAKKEFFVMEKEKFDKHIELTKMQMEKKEREIQDTRNDAKRREELQQQQINNQEKLRMQEYQKQQEELAKFRERDQKKLQKKKQCIVM